MTASYDLQNTQTKAMLWIVFRVHNGYCLVANEIIVSIFSNYDFEHVFYKPTFNWAVLSRLPQYRTSRCTQNEIGRRNKKLCPPTRCRFEIDREFDGLLQGRRIRRVTGRSERTVTYNNYVYKLQKHLSPR